MSAFTEVEVKIPVTGAPLVELTDGKETVRVQPVHARYSASIYGDAFYEWVTVYGPEYHNETLYEPFPDWLPEPPAWFTDAVEELRAREEKELES